MDDSAQMVREHTDTADSLVRQLYRAQSLRHDGTDAQIHGLALYASIVELFSGCNLLAKTDETTGIAVLLRPMYEALVDLDNLVHDPSYVEHIEAASLMQLIKLLSSARSNNPLLQSLSDGHAAEVQAMTDRFDELKARGKRPLKIEDRCRRAGRLDEYESLYGLFCLDSHNNIAALADRHLSKESDGVPRITIFQKPDPRVVARRLGLGMGILVEAAQMIHGAFRIAPEQLDALAAQYQHGRAERLLALQASSDDRPD
jgi:Family of unknown function (DUF5677)